MKKFVVGYCSLFDNDLVLEIVEAESAENAFFKCTVITSADWFTDIPVKERPETLEKIKDWMFDNEVCFNVIEI